MQRARGAGARGELDRRNIGSMREALTVVRFVKDPARPDLQERIRRRGVRPRARGHAPSRRGRRDTPRDREAATNKHDRTRDTSVVDGSQDQGKAPLTKPPPAARLGPSTMNDVCRSTTSIFCICICIYTVCTHGLDRHM